MPPVRSDRRRRRRDDPSARYRPRCVQENVLSVQKQQEASSITPTSSSSSGTPQEAHDAFIASPSSEHCLSSSAVSHVFARTELEWGYTYFIRLDLQGFFHTYPDVGGPYQSLQEADKAIDRHLEERRHPKMSRMQDDVSPIDTIIQRRLYWPDGTSKRRSKSHGLQDGRDEMCRLVRALLDKYNEGYPEDRKYELKDVLNFQSICEELDWYYHLNFITTSKAEDDLEVFAEVRHVNAGKHLEMSMCCFCMVDPIDKGQHCNGCTIIGNVDMKHPHSSVQLAAGQLDPRCQCCELFRGEPDSEDEDTFMKAKEAELRRKYKGLEDRRGMERLISRYSGIRVVSPSD